MADQFLKDRQDIPIWNAIEANNLKQALKLVEKRLQKKPSDYLEALKIYIRSRSPLLSEKSAVLLHLEQLLERKTALTDLEAIELFEEALDGVLPDSPEGWAKIIGELRWQYVKSNPKDEEAGKKCFQSCLLQDDLDHARQIANSLGLEKNYPDSHEYPFWNIASMFLYSRSSKYSQKERTIFGKLALGQIGKFALSTKQAGTSKKLPPRSIQTPQELLLQHLLTEEHGTSEQRLDLLKDPYLGPESSVAKGEWQLWRYKLQLMSESQLWGELFQTTRNLLRRARTKDASGKFAESRYSDWLVWECFLRSAKEISQPQHANEVRAEMEAHLDPSSGLDKSWRRNASLAWVLVTFESVTSFENVNLVVGSARIAPIVKYLQQYGDASTAYTDLRPFVERLSTEERSKLLKTLLENRFDGADEQKNESGTTPTFYPAGQDVSTANNIIRLVNSYKLIYLLAIAIPEYERQSDPDYKTHQFQFVCSACSKPCALHCALCLENLSRSTMESYRNAIDDDGVITKSLLATDRHPADDLCILSAMCFIKLSITTPGSITPEFRSDTHVSRLLQATVLLENAWSHSKSNFQISLLLVKLYSSLGCGSLALRAYQRLGLKQVQLDSLSCILFDRISTLHPHPVQHNPDESSESRNPAEYLEKQQKFYKAARGQISKNRWKCFEQGSYNSIFEITQVSEMLFHSMSSISSVVESRKIARLLTPGTPLTALSCGYDILPHDIEDPNTTIFDTNDFGSFPNFETIQSRPFISTLHQRIATPTVFRIRLNLMAENLKMTIDPASDSIKDRSIPQSWLSSHVKEIRERHGKDQEHISLGLTECEAIFARSVDAIAYFINRACDREQWSEQKNDLNSWNKHLHQQLEALLAHVGSIQESSPASQLTLHSLYTAYELGTMVINFKKYISKLDANSGLQEYADDEIVTIIQRLLEIVASKSTSIKKSLDESGWIDRVLESLLQNSQDDTDDSSSAKGILEKLVDDNFMEEWAGNVVESWRDSVIGFSHFKVPGAGKK